MIGFSSSQVLIEFGESIAVAIALTSLLIALSRLFDLSNSRTQSVVVGVGFGLIAAAIMIIPVEILPGIQMDGRLVPLAVAGLFGGTAAAIIATVIAAAAQIALNGPVVPELLATAAAGALGAASWSVWGERIRRFNALQYFCFGIAVFVLTIGELLPLPHDQLVWAVSTVTVPAAIFIPLGTMLLGVLLSTEFKRADADAELRRRETQFREVIENSPSAVYLKDLDGRYLMVNEEFLKRYRLTNKDIIGKTTENVFSTRMARRLRAQDDSVISERRPKTFEVETPYADGTDHKEIASKFPIFGDDRSVVGIGGVTTDITELTQAKEAVRVVEERYREFFENAELVFVGLDRNGRISACNDHLLSLTGYDRAEVIGADWFDAFIPNEERGVIRQIFLDTVASGTVAVPPHFENDIQTKDRKFRTIAWDSVVNRDTGGQVTGVSCVGVDVTERRRAVIEIQREKDRAEQFLAIAGTIIIALNSDATVILINRKGCEVLGYSKEELIGANWITTAIPDELRERVSGVLQKIMAGEIEPVERFENEVVTKSGDRRLIAWTNSYIADDRGEITASLSSGEDITDRARAEKEAKVLQDRLAHVARLSTMGEMAAGFAHELNQPLAAISNYAGGTLRYLQRGKAKAEDLVPALEKLSEQAERDGEVIRRIRWFVQKNAPNKTPTDINSTIRNAAEFMHNEFIENDIVLDFQLCEGLPRIPVDAIQIQQVVMNLSRNAIEAMRSDNQIPKKLTIGTAAEGSGIEVTVSDTGPGLSPDVEAELFEPFVTDKPEGMGIGLSICRSLVQAHGGRLYAESVPGQGTVFRFTIPHEPVD